MLKNLSALHASVVYTFRKTMPTILFSYLYNHFTLNLPFIVRKLKKANRKSKSGSIDKFSVTFVKG